MAHSETDRQKVIDLANNGEKPKDIALKLEIPLRTVQRWIYAQKALNSANFSPQATQALNAGQPGGVNAIHQATMWLDDIDEILQHQGSEHRHFSSLIRQKLEDELSKPDASPRTINTLSLALSRHLDGELKAALAGKERLIDHHQAMSVLISYGYAVVNVEKMQEELRSNE